MATPNVPQWPIPPAADLQSLALWCRQVGDLLTGRLANLGVIPDGSVGTTQIADGAVTTAKIGNGQVTNAKLANMVQATIKGRAAEAGTGVPQDLTAAQVHGILDPSRVEVIATGSLVGAAQFDITDIPATFNHLILSVSGLSHNGNGGDQTPWVRASRDNGASFFTADYRNAPIVPQNSAAWSALGNHTMVEDTANSPAGQTWAFCLQLFGYQGSQLPRYFFSLDRQGIVHVVGAGGIILGLGAINALRVMFSAGGIIDGGTYELLGVR